MITSETIAKIAPALVGLQAEIPSILKDAEVKVSAKSGGFSFRYATLEAILSVLRPLLAKHKLAVIQSPRELAGGAQGLLTTILHESGEWIANEVMIIARENGAQAYGSALSYAARYGISRIFCLSTMDDDDGNIADGNHMDRKLPELIDTESLARLRERLEELACDVPEFCRYMQITSLDKLPKARIGYAFAALNRKEQKAAGNA